MKDLKTILEMDRDYTPMDPGDKQYLSDQYRHRNDTIDYLDSAVKNDATTWVSYANANYIKNLICYIADNGKIGIRAKKESTKQRQQDVIDICKNIKKQMKW